MYYFVCDDVLSKYLSSSSAKLHFFFTQSYNILLPNSQDGWWTYKMYLPPLTDADQSSIFSTWEYRKSLLRERIGLINADVVCLQEVSPLSFDDDFAFMLDDLGYDGVELYRKGRFRPATFWKKNRLVLVDIPQHKDRTLMTSFRRIVHDDESSSTSAKSISSSNEEEYYWHILNCHLQAGKQGGRRVRQIIEGTNAAIKMAKKHQMQKEHDHVDKIQLIVCGDFNGGQECGAIHYLESGSIGPEFLEDGEQVSSKEKILPIPPLTDAVANINREGALPPPATLVVPELISYLIGNSRDDDDDGTITTTAYEDPYFSEDVINRLRRIYSNFAATVCDTTAGKQMGKTDVERWLTIINQRVGRGTEFRNAAKCMGWVEPTLATNEEIEKDDRLPIIIPENGILTLEDFIGVYIDELRQCKFWGIAWDLASLGEPLPGVNNVFRARYDRMYASQSLLPVVVLDTISDKACPNEYEPSDHLPVCAVFLPRR